MSPTQIDVFWMKRCAEFAQESLDTGDAAVGALLVRQSDNQEIAHAQETVLSAGDLTGHAEINVLRRGVTILGISDLSGCTLYTTVEPCWMCSYLLRELRVSRIVIGRPLFDIGGASSLYPILRDISVPEWGQPPEIVFFDSSTSSL